jgi:hypothetical protein
MEIFVFRWPLRGLLEIVCSAILRVFVASREFHPFWKRASREDVKTRRREGSGKTCGVEIAWLSSKFRFRHFTLWPEIIFGTPSTREGVAGERGGRFCKRLATGSGGR